MAPRDSGVDRFRFGHLLGSSGGRLFPDGFSQRGRDIPLCHLRHHRERVGRDSVVCGSTKSGLQLPVDSRGFDFRGFLRRKFGFGGGSSLRR